MTERFRRRDFGHMELQVTIDDPAVYAKPLTLSRRRQPRGGHRAHRVRVSRRTRRIACTWSAGRRRKRPCRSRRTSWRPTSGVYQVTATPVRAAGARGAATVFTVTLEDGQLLIDLRGKGKVPMIPLSQTMFSPRLLGTYEFVKDGSGPSPHAGALGGGSADGVDGRSVGLQADVRLRPDATTALHSRVGSSASTRSCMNMAPRAPSSDAVVARQRDRHHRLARRCRPCTGTSAIFHRADGENARLRRHDDRRERVHVVHPEIADREGRAGDVGRRQLVRARALGEVAAARRDVAEAACRRSSARRRRRPRR